MTYFSNNKSNFVSLKRILSILSFVLLVSIQSRAQSIDPGAGGTRIAKMYPNPATTFVTFDLQKDNDKGLSIQVYSMVGKKMFESPNVKQKVTVNVEDFNRGLYIYHVVDKNGRIVESGKFNVSR